MNIQELKALWEQEQESYKSVEIGSGVQKFVKKFFECEDLFRLTEGKLSTADLKRKNEFLTEARKNGRRADVVIFVNPDVVIPVEIEKHSNIEAGVEQIFNYQADWTKKYGLLTDGNQWRFYNNRFIEKTFFIGDIFQNPTDFLTYWKEYTTDDYYYLSFFDKKGQDAAAEVPAPNLDDVREDFFENITKLIEKFENKLNLKGYFTNLNSETEKKKKAVEITYAYLIQFILYKVLVDNAFGEFDQDWELRLKSIDRAIKAGTYGDILTKIKAISDKISDRIYKRFNDEQLLIGERLKQILQKPQTEITDISVWLDILLFINRYNFANVQNEIFGYVYENYLKDIYLNEKKGQYFTDPSVVEFMLDEIGFTSEQLKKRYKEDKDSISIIDPSCGSGTFLYNATYRLTNTFFDGSDISSKTTESIINENVFGLDISEFPLYLAEMNILMRMLPIIINEKYNNPYDKKIKVFKTRDSIAEFLDTEIRNTLSDINVASHKANGQMSFFQDFLDLGYNSFLRNEDDLEDLKKSLENNEKISRYRFDYVVGNPPYVSYNECAGQNIPFFELLKKGMVKLNDVYGINLHSVEENRKKYPPKPNLYSFFIALGLALLKDGGKLCYIIPQTLITESDYDVLRWYLAKFTTIEKIFFFGNPMFIGRGLKQKNTITTSSLIIVINKSKPIKNHKVQVYFYENNENNVNVTLKNIKNSQKATHTSINQTVLLKNYLNWVILKFNKQEINLYNEYLKKSESLAHYSNHKLAQMNFNSEFYFDVGFILDKNQRTSKKVNEDDYELINLKNFISYGKYKSSEYYPNNKELIKLPKNSQGYITLTKKYKIIWGKVYSNRFYFTDKNVLPSMSFTQFIASDNKEELLYLFALLNSKLNNFIFQKLFSLQNEKYGIFIVIKRIKEFIKIPIINDKNQRIKNEIIAKANEMLEMEKTILSDYVDFKNIMMQKFNSVEIADGKLILRYKENEAVCKILAHNDIVENAVSPQNIEDILNSEGVGNISDLKEVSAYNESLQQEIKDYIDTLVFALYFQIDLPEKDFSKREELKKICSQNEFYELVNE